MGSNGNSSPAVGNGQFALVVEGAPAKSTGLLLIGFGRANGKVVDLTVLVNLNGGLVLPMQVDARGGLAIPLGIPNNAQLVNGRVNFQTAMNATCGLLGLAASRGLEVTIVK